jgi:hypothetical protein
VSNWQKLPLARAKRQPQTVEAPALRVIDVEPTVQKDKYINGSVTLYLPDWSSGKAAINHLCKVCDSVEIAEKTEAKTAFVKE